MAELDYQKIYSEVFLRNLDTEKKAVEGVIYKRDDGEYFVGNRYGVLEKLQKAKYTPLESKTGLDSKNVEDAIDELHRSHFADAFVLSTINNC